MNRRVESASDRIMRVFAPLPAGYRVTNRRGNRAAGDLVTYLPDGSTRRNTTLQICPPQGASAGPWSVVINLVGRPRLARKWGKCPA
jgi:hypothetical protein